MMYPKIKRNKMVMNLVLILGGIARVTRTGMRPTNAATNDLVGFQRIDKPGKVGSALEKELVDR